MPESTKGAHYTAENGMVAKSSSYLRKMKRIFFNHLMSRKKSNRIRAEMIRSSAN